MSRTPSNRRRNSLVKIEIDKILYSTSELISSQVLSIAVPANGSKGVIEMWELENRLTPTFNSAINSIRDVSAVKAEDLSFELTRRGSAIVDDLISLLLECLRDAFRASVDIDYPIPRTIHVIFKSKVDNTSFIKKEYTSKVYEVLKHLLR